MEKSDFIQKVEKERNLLDIALIRILEHDDLLSNVNGQWVIKDLIAHIVWYEKEMINLINSKSMTSNAEIWKNPTEKRNQIVYNLFKNQSSEQVIENYHYIGKNLIKLLKEINPEMYSDPALYEAMPSDWFPYIIFRENTFTHYQDHLRQLSIKFRYLKE